MDMYGMEEIEEEEINTKPTIEDIKKIVDSKRIKRSPSKTYTKEDRLKNLELAREKRKNTKNKIITITEKKQEQEPIKSIKINENKLLENLNTSTPIINNDLFNEIKELILNQNQILNNINIKPKPKPKSKPKPKDKDKGKTLDLVVSDKEIEQIINPPTNNTKTIDSKLQAFLDAFKK